MTDREKFAIKYALKCFLGLFAGAAAFWYLCYFLYINFGWGVSMIFAGGLVLSIWIPSTYKELVSIGSRKYSRKYEEKT